MQGCESRLDVGLQSVFAAAKCQKADGIACPKNDGYNIHIIEKGKALLF